MPEDRNITPENDREDQVDRFESDTQKLTRKHLEDENHVFTEEEIRNLRVGMTPPALDEATEARFEDEEAKEKVEEKLIGDEDNLEEDKKLEKPGQKITPWDTISE
jgi:hypothetical protein